MGLFCGLHKIMYITNFSYYRIRFNIYHYPCDFVLIGRVEKKASQNEIKMRYMRDFIFNI